MQTLLAMWLTLILSFTSVFGLVGDKYKVYENIRYGEAERDLVTIYVPDTDMDGTFMRMAMLGLYACIIAPVTSLTTLATKVPR